jgi:MMPL family protein
VRTTVTVSRWALLGIMVIVVSVAIARPAYADPDTDFGNELHAYGIYGPKDYNAWIGKITCKRFYNGLDQDAEKSAKFVFTQLPKGSTTEQGYDRLQGGSRCWTQHRHHPRNGRHRRSRHRRRTGVRRHPRLVHRQRPGHDQQIGTTICLGLIFDTLIVRSLMTPSIAALLGRWFWPLNVRTRPASQIVQPFGSRISVRKLLGPDPKPATDGTDGA